jgi:phospholipid/cholesterol/gamma-HCH transport system substrate-binding protein
LKWGTGAAERKEYRVKKNKMELIVGGTILIAAIILIAGVLWLKGAMVTGKLVEYTVLFPNVGTLNLGDPVMVNGVKKGNVNKVYLYGPKVAVDIKMEKDVPLTDSSKITVQNIGLMGERMVGVQLSGKGARSKPNGKGKNETTYINGYFDTGIAEAMGMVGTVLGDVRELVKNVSLIVDSTVGDTVFFRKFRRIVSRLDTVTNMAEDLIGKNRPSINRSMANIERVTSDVNALLDTNKPRINTILANGAELSVRGVSVAGKIDSLSRSIQTMINRINNGEGSIGLLLKDEKFYYDLKKSIGDLDTLLGEVNRKGLKLNIVKLHWPW